MITPISQIPLLLLSLDLISSYDCRQHGYDPNPLIESEQDNRFYYENLGPPALQSYYESYVSGDKNKKISKIIADRPYEIQGSNERSVADSEVQRTQKDEMKGFQDENQVDETVNGLIKIVNLPKRYPSLINKRGQLDERRPSDDSVVIPAPPAEPRLYVPEIPESCKRMQICDDVINYPRELADKFFAELGDKRDMFNFDKEETEVEQRKYSADQSNELCSSTEKVVKAAPSVTGDWYYVVYDEKSPLLNYRVKICNTYEGEPCSPSMVHFFKGYKGTCRQNNITRKMAVFGHNGTIIYKKLMKVPSGCSCVATFDGKKKD